MARRPHTRGSIVGLDIEPGYAVAAEVGAGARIAVERAAAIALAPGVIRDGEVVDVEGLSEALRAMFQQHRLGRRVRLGVANQRIVMRTLDLPPLENPKELEAAVRFQAQDNIPMALDQAVIDFQPVGLVDTDQGRRQRVVLVAARRDMIEHVLAAARGAGLRPEGIDLSAFAMIRALRAAAPAEPGAELYVAVGGLTNLAVAEGATCLFTRVISGGLEGMVERLAERRGLTLEHARQWFVHVGLTAPVESVDGDPTIVGEARAVLADGVRRIADEVRNSLDFYRTQIQAQPVERATLTGPAVSIPGFAEQLAIEVGLPVHAGLVAEGRPGGLSGIDPGMLAIAAGLAVEDAPA